MLTLIRDKMRSSAMITSRLSKDDPITHKMQSIVPSSHDCKTLFQFIILDHIKHEFISTAKKMQHTYGSGSQYLEKAMEAFFGAVTDIDDNVQSMLLVRTSENFKAFIENVYIITSTTNKQLVNTNEAK